MRTGVFVVVTLVALLFIVSLIAPNVLSVLPARSLPEDGYWQSVENQGRTHIAPGEEHPGLQLRASYIRLALQHPVRTGAMARVHRAATR